MKLILLYSSSYETIWYSSWPMILRDDQGNDQNLNDEVFGFLSSFCRFG